MKVIQILMINEDNPKFRFIFSRKLNSDLVVVGVSQHFGARGDGDGGTPAVIQQSLANEISSGKVS